MTLLHLNEKEVRLVRKAAKGLIAIAEDAMPDTYLATDSRVKAARKLFERLENR